MATPDPSKPFVLDLETALSIGAALSLMPAANLLQSFLLPKHATTTFTTRFLFAWHAYDALTHFILEGSFLFHCFTSYTTLTNVGGDDAFAHPTGLHGSYFLNREDRLYGPFFGTGPMARLWQEYAKADKRWAGADLTVISLELLTVFLGGPAATYICYLLYKTAHAAAKGASASVAAAPLSARLWVIAIMLATGELYGGFMTFAPEWLSGNANLETGDWMYMWVYLVFFNVLWVFVPFWVIWVGWGEIAKAFKGTASKDVAKTL